MYGQDIFVCCPLIEILYKYLVHTLKVVYIIHIYEILRAPTFMSFCKLFSNSRQNFVFKFEASGKW